MYITIIDDLTNSSGIVSSNQMGYFNYSLGKVNKDAIQTAENINYNNILFFLIPNSYIELMCSSNKFNYNCFNKFLKFIVLLTIIFSFSAYCKFINNSLFSMQKSYS